MFNKIKAFLKNKEVQKWCLQVVLPSAVVLAIAAVLIFIVIKQDDGKNILNGNTPESSVSGDAKSTAAPSVTGTVNGQNNSAVTGTDENTNSPLVTGSPDNPNNSSNPNNPTPTKSNNTGTTFVPVNPSDTKTSDPTAKPTATAENYPPIIPGTFPNLNINFNNGQTLNNLNKDNYIGARISMENAGQYNVALQSAGVRLRGNSTAGLPKKPMRIRFDEQVSMFGRPAERSWVLLADSYDFSHMRNYLAHHFYKEFSIPGTFASLAEYVNVYVNLTTPHFSRVKNQKDKNQEGLG